MEYSALYQKYEALLTTLKEIIAQSQARVLREAPDDIFSENINFFVKSYLINICTYLEAYLQDVALEYSGRVTVRLKQANIPHNFLYGKLAKDIKEKELKYVDASYAYTKKELSDIISGNPYKTINAFRLIGIDLGSSEKFVEHKNLVGTIVNKRNNIIHYNDEASDISFSDLLVHIDVFLEYMLSIESLLSASE
ncbi:HEPN domain-containing protein [Neptunicella marina]|uniref:RiboL-PSP-HEPN domain-containing protein n=1 Tax=Neptunicella marina TaxID=2125989 RepID=A0A8J6IQG5_9ALTE|nr:HEPN domain-containing protein [Neptunicella marina]MBC3765076.1 hypothetical protein [Neptunicella marina]